MRPIHTLFLLAAVASSAAPVSYTNLANWQAAGPQDPGFIGFESQAAGQYGVGQAATSFALSGFTFAGIGGNLIIYNPIQAWSNLGAGVSLTGPQGTGASISITFPSAVYGIGFLIASSNGSDVTVVINGDSVNAISVSAPAVPPGPGAFWGVRNDVPITTLTLTGASGMRPSIDSVIWGGQGAPPPPPNETPEATTAILIGSALLLLPTLRRRFAISSNSSSPTAPQQLAH
jgi:hypothetical protein